MPSTSRPYQNVLEGEDPTRITHLGIGAHHDDLEFMCLHGILAGLEQDCGFGGIVCTDGAGSVGEEVGSEELCRRRIREQREAARIGEYRLMAQLGFSSAEVKSPAGRKELESELAALIRRTAPEVLYTHNPFDKHPTHLAVFQAVVATLRRLPADQRPAHLLGCEVWQGLDWLAEEDKVVLDVSIRPELAERLNAVFRTQIEGGKRYDLAVEGRRRANATFLDAHQADWVERAEYAVDLTPLIREPFPEVTDFVAVRLDRFREKVLEGVRELSR